MKLLVVVSVALLGFISSIEGHGRMMEPVSRSSAWRKGFNTPKNYDDDGIYCGGFGLQQKLGMKCGICGDAYNAKRPRDNENTGRYGKGVITGTYKPGSVIETKIQLTTNHWGQFTFSLCPLATKTTLEEESCFRNLKLADGSDVYKLKTKQSGWFKVKVQLPADIKKCDQCVLRWIYRAGNNWGCEMRNGKKKCCVGCGKIQEHFMNCADIKIE